MKACKGVGESESANGLGKPRTRDLYLRQARIESSDSRDRTDLQKVYEAGAKQVRWPRPFQQRGEAVPVKHNALCVIGAGRPARCGVRAACCSSRVAWQGQPARRPGGDRGARISPWALMSSRKTRCNQRVGAVHAEQRAAVIGSAGGTTRVMRPCGCGTDRYRPSARGGCRVRNSAADRWVSIGQSPSRRGLAWAGSVPSGGQVCMYAVRGLSAASTSVVRRAGVISRRAPARKPGGAD